MRPRLPNVEVAGRANVIYFLRQEGHTAFETVNETNRLAGVTRSVLKEPESGLSENVC